MDRQNRILAITENAWRLKGPDYALGRANRLENLLRLATNGNPAIASQFYQHRAAWQKLVSMLTNQGKFRTLQSDRLHAIGRGFPNADVGQTLAYPGITASNPKRQVQIRDSDPKPTNPGFLHWHSLAAAAGRVLKDALEGVQVYSKNQVQLGYLEEHEQAFNVRQAFADLEAAVSTQHELAYRSSLDYVVHAQQLGEDRDAAWLAHVHDSTSREELGFLQEGQSIAKRNALKDALSLQKAAQVTATFNGLEDIRTQLIGTLVGKEGDFGDPAAQTVVPEGPAWSVDRALLERLRRRRGVIGGGKQNARQ